MQDFAGEVWGMECLNTFSPAKIVSSKIARVQPCICHFTPHLHVPSSWVGVPMVPWKG